MSARVDQRSLFATGNRPFAHSKDVAVGILEPGTARRADLRDEVRRLGRLIFVEWDAARGEVSDSGLDVVHLEVPDGLAHVRLAAPYGDLRSLAGAKPESERRLIQQRKSKLLLKESLRAVKVSDGDGGSSETRAAGWL